MARKSRFSELCKDTSLIFLLVGINGLQRDILYQGFRSRWSRVRLLMEVSRVEGTMSRVDFLLVVFYVFFLRFLSEWGSADTEMHCWGPPRGCMFPCSLEKFRAVPLFLMNRLSCSRNSLLPSSPVPRNSASCSVDPQKYFYIFPTISFIFHFVMVSYFHRFYLVSHSTDTPRQNASFASLMTLTGCRVCSDSSFATYAASVQVSALFEPWISSWKRMMSSHLSSQTS